MILISCVHNQLRTGRPPGSHAPDLQRARAEHARALELSEVPRGDALARVAAAAAAALGAVALEDVHVLLIALAVQLLGLGLRGEEVRAGAVFA